MSVCLLLFCLFVTFFTMLQIFNNYEQIKWKFLCCCCCSVHSFIFAWLQIFGNTWEYLFGVWCLVSTVYWHLFNLIYCYNVTYKHINITYITIPNFNIYLMLCLLSTVYWIELCWMILNKSEVCPPAYITVTDIWR